MNQRRQVMRAAALSMFAGSALAARPRAGGAAGIEDSYPEHSVAGGLGGIVRARYGMVGLEKNSGYQVIYVPSATHLYMLPVGRTFFDESGGGPFCCNNDGMVTIRRTGFYELTANIDWPGQHGLDIDLRLLYIRRVRVGQPAPAFTPGQMTVLPADGEQYDTLAVRDIAASDVPKFSRAAYDWTPGTIAPGAFVSTEVTLPAGSLKLNTGDAAMVGHTALSNRNLGGANAGLLMTARVTGPGTVRVWIENRYAGVPVTVPAGTLEVLGTTTVDYTGNSADAYTYLSTPTVYLYEGERVMVAVHSRTPGDYVQCSYQTFLQVRSVA